jgi:hypothetical protein
LSDNFDLASSRRLLHLLHLRPRTYLDLITHTRNHNSEQCQTLELGMVDMMRTEGKQVKVQGPVRFPGYVCRSPRSISVANFHHKQSTVAGEYGLKLLSAGENPVVEYTSSLNPVEQPAANYRISVIAVHGFNGHLENTWTAENSILWLRDLLPQEVPRARILTFGYDTGNRQVFDVGESLVSELSLERRKNKVGTSPRILFFLALSDAL